MKGKIRKLKKVTSVNIKKLLNKEQMKVLESVIEEESKKNVMKVIKTDPLLKKNPIFVALMTGKIDNLEPAFMSYPTFTSEHKQVVHEFLAKLFGTRIPKKHKPLVQYIKKLCYQYIFIWCEDYEKICGSAIPKATSDVL